MHVRLKTEQEHAGVCIPQSEPSEFHKLQEAELKWNMAGTKQKNQGIPVCSLEESSSGPGSSPGQAAASQFVITKEESLQE